MPDQVAKVSLREMLLQASLILAVSLAATLAAWRWTAQQGHTLETIRFNQEADEAVDEIRDRLEGYQRMLTAGVALLEATGGVDRGQWRIFVERLDVGGLTPGTQGVGFAQRVPAVQWPEHEEFIRAQGFPDYRIKPEHPRDLAFPIVYLEPFSGRNLRAFGYDMFSEPIRREAMERARDSALPTLSGKVVLRQETEEDVQAGVLLYVPYYGTSTPPPSQRRDAIQGFVYSPLRMDDMVRGVLGERLDRLCVEIYDQDPTAPNLLFANPDCSLGEHRREIRLAVAGREWVMHIGSTPALDATVASQRSKLILGAGTVISLLLVWAVTSMLAERRQRVVLARTTVALERARTEAAGALAAKARFMAAASHDLRQPLQSLGMFLHVMIEQRGTEGPVERAARQAFDATARLVEAMFDAAALESGQAEPVRERVDLAELIDAIAEESRAEADSRGLTLRTRLCRAEVETDRVMLERILRNLISNALKYTRTGGVLVACRTTASAVRIKVADSGPGIPPDKRDLIFEDFFQIENPERDPRKGLGLGLATVARTARALGYRLSVLSREGVGSSFVVEIPRATTAPPDRR